MQINGREVTFRLNIRATKRIANLCPNRDISQIDKLFNDNDFANLIENIEEIAIAMSLNKENKKPLTAEELEDMDISELTVLTDELRTRFGIDRGTNVETKPIKKKGTKVSVSSSD